MAPRCDLTVPPSRFSGHPGTPPREARARAGTHLTSGSFSGRAGSSRHRHGQQQQALRSQRRSPMESEGGHRGPRARRATAAGARGRGWPRRHGPGRAHHAAAGGTRGARFCGSFSLSLLIPRVPPERMRPRDAPLLPSKERARSSGSAEPAEGGRWAPAGSAARGRTQPSF